MMGPMSTSGTSTTMPLTSLKRREEARLVLAAVMAREAIMHVNAPSAPHSRAAAAPGWRHQAAAVPIEAMSVTAPGTPMKLDRARPASRLFMGME